MSVSGMSHSLQIGSSILVPPRKLKKVKWFKNWHQSVLHPGGENQWAVGSRVERIRRCSGVVRGTRSYAHYNCSSSKYQGHTMMYWERVQVCRTPSSDIHVIFVVDVRLADWMVVSVSLIGWWCLRRGWVPFGAECVGVKVEMPRVRWCSVVHDDVISSITTIQGGVRDVICDIRIPQWGILVTRLESGSARAGIRIVGGFVSGFL